MYPHAPPALPPPYPAAMPFTDALKTADGLKRAGGDIQLDAAFSYRYPKCYGTLLTHLEKSYIDKTEVRWTCCGHVL